MRQWLHSVFFYFISTVQHLTIYIYLKRIIPYSHFFYPISFAYQDRIIIDNIINAIWIFLINNTNLCNQCKLSIINIYTLAFFVLRRKIRKATVQQE